ncbi:unnamed protein product [Rotaria magnacalcarata]|uniref:Uncharacterized protein n=1 Tax=Rotaria magnacalcarata TaxID=392030 RepID=A0A816X8B4_9BILA|nr:unnamed protein product [Rotaria magnacalcarata]
MCICISIIIIVLILIRTVRYALRRRSPIKYVNEADLSRFGNVSWPQQRIPRVIHQTYRTHDVPEIWNSTVQSVMKMNVGDFEYRRWSHFDMDAFVRQREPDFYRNTFVHYAYDMQRIDSFRYVLMYHIGGVYIDMDSACYRPLREFVTTLEALDPDAPYLALFPAEDAFGVQTDFIAATPGHPIYKQFISRLPLFHHYFLIHHITILLSAGPLFASFQERFFHQTDQQVVRILKNKVYITEFWKTNGECIVNIDYLQLQSLSFVNFEQQKLLGHLTDEITVFGLLTNQITHLKVDILLDKNQLNIFLLILSLDKHLTDLTFHRRFSSEQLGNPTFDLSPSHTSSTLTKLIINVTILDDCLYLLNGSLESLTALVIDTNKITYPSSNIDNMIIMISIITKLPKLKQFSLTSHRATSFYGDQVIPLYFIEWQISKI